LFDDFFTRALIAGIGVALAAGPLGCFIVWRRMAYFGDTISHSALLGVALGFLADVDLILAVFLVAAMVAVGLMVMQRANTLSSDAILGILSHSTLAIGLVIVAFMTWLRIDLVAYLFGDILAVTTHVAGCRGRGADNEGCGYFADHGTLDHSWRYGAQLLRDAGGYGCDRRGHRGAGRCCGPAWVALSGHTGRADHRCRRIGAVHCQHGGSRHQAVASKPGRRGASCNVIQRG